MRSKLLLLLFIFISGCTNVFFQPLRPHLTHPDEFPTPPKDIFFSSSDGTQIHAWWFATDQKKVLGTIVQFHGNAENVSTHAPAMLWFLKYGYNVFSFDYRGYGKSEGAPFHPGIRLDARSAIDQARTLSGETTPIILYGQSLGGVILLDALMGQPPILNLSAVILEGTFYAHKAIGREMLSRSWITWPFQGLSYLLVSNRYSPKKTLRRAPPKVPVLLIHSEKDPVIPFRYGKKVYDHLWNPRCLLRVPEAGHIGLTSLAKGKYRENVLKFLLDQRCPTSP